VKRILIAGENSYVGRSFMHHVRDVYSVQELSVRDEGWHSHDFSQYDVVLHVAAIVHQKNQTDRNLYYRVNRDIPRAVCHQAVSQGVKHFIFLSTMAVYGVAPSRLGEGCITSARECHPCTIYGESKLAAECDLQKLQQEHQFMLSIIRPPMIYGPGCPGNYFHRLMWMGRFLPVFPSVRKNRLSMIGIGNLCELLRLIVENDSTGIYCPQDQDGFGTQDRLKIIAELYGRNIHISKLLGLPIRWLPLTQLDSLYGDLYYGDDINHFEGKYAIDTFSDTIEKIRCSG